MLHLWFGAQLKVLQGITYYFHFTLSLAHCFSSPNVCLLKAPIQKGFELGALPKCKWFSLVRVIQLDLKHRN